MSKKTVNIVIRLPKSLHSQLANLSHHTGESINTLMLDAIRAELYKPTKEINDANSLDTK